MPGITGIIGPGSSDHHELELHRMLAPLAHDPTCATRTFFDSRLRTWVGWAGPRNGTPEDIPVVNELRGIYLAFNGDEEANADNIASSLSTGLPLSGERAGSLIRLYEDKGEDFVRTLNGPFSGVVADSRRNLVMLFNDRYGLGRIYYHEDRGRFLFSTEAKSLLTVLPRLRNLDPRSLGESLILGCALQNRSLFAGISLLPPGSVWTFSPTREARKKTYFLPASLEGARPLAAQEYVSLLKQTWERILPRYFSGKKRIGLSLTGGKDSRMILAYAPSPPGSLPCYTFRGPYRENSDTKLAKRIADICQQPFRAIVLGREFLAEFPALAERTVCITDGAMDVSGAAELYVNRIARQIAPTRLTGNYAQEILRCAVAFKPMPFFRGLLDAELSQALDTAITTYHSERAGHPLSFVVAKQMPWHHYARLSLESSQMALRSPFLDNELLELSYQAPRDTDITQDAQLKLISEGNPLLGSIGTDRGLRYRQPAWLTGLRTFLHEISARAEYAFDYGMPRWLARIDGTTKALHVERLVLGRHKFAHYRIWYRDQLSEYVRSVLLDPRTIRRPYLNGRKLEPAIREHLLGTRNLTLEIHRLLTVELTQRQFIDRD